MKMNFKFPLIAAAAVSLVAIPVIAQQPNEVDVLVVEGVNNPAPQGQPGQPPKVNPFEGLNLTEQQQQAIAALQNECRQACNDSVKVKKDAKKDGKKDGKKDKKADKQQFNPQQQGNPQEQAEKLIAARKEYLAKVKAILTPEQYTQYLENEFVNAAPANNGPQGRGGRPGGPGAPGAPGQGGPRGNR